MNGPTADQFDPGGFELPLDRLSAEMARLATTGRNEIDQARMPIGFYIYREFRLLFIRGHGVITQAERVETMLAWLRDPGYQHCTDALFDVTGAQSTPKLAELRQIIAILQQHMPSSGPRKLAIVTARPITYAVARVFQELIQPKDIPLQVKVFFDREAAWAWLRPDEPLPEPK